MSIFLVKKEELGTLRFGGIIKSDMYPFLKTLVFCFALRTKLCKAPDRFSWTVTVVTTTFGVKY